jgi:hypothetical protein
LFTVEGEVKLFACALEIARGLFKPYVSGAGVRARNAEVCSLYRKQMLAAKVPGKRADLVAF